MTARKEEKWRGTVKTTWNLRDGFSHPRDGWAVPRVMKIDAELPGDVQVHIDVEVVEGKARARNVTVSTTNPHGVGWAALSKVPARDLVATAVLRNLARTEPAGKSRERFLPPQDEDVDTIRQIVQASVGYKPNTDGFERGEA